MNRFGEKKAEDRQFELEYRKRRRKTKQSDNSHFNNQRDKKVLSKYYGISFRSASKARKYERHYGPKNKIRLDDVNFFVISDNGNRKELGGPVNLTEEK